MPDIPHHCSASRRSRIRSRDAGRQRHVSVAEVANEHIYSDQEISGATNQRPGYQRLMGAANRHEFNAIIVEDQDRLWRDQAEMHAALKRLRFRGLKVISVVTGTNLTDKTGSIVAAIKGWQDEAFLDSLREKTRRGMEGEITRGLSAGIWISRCADWSLDDRSCVVGRATMGPHSIFVQPSLGFS